MRCDRVLSSSGSALASCLLLRAPSRGGLRVALYSPTISSYITGILRISEIDCVWNILLLITLRRSFVFSVIRKYLFFKAQPDFTEADSNEASPYIIDVTIKANRTQLFECRDAIIARHWHDLCYEIKSKSPASDFYQNDCFVTSFRNNSEAKSALFPRLLQTAT